MTKKFETDALRWTFYNFKMDCSLSHLETFNNEFFLDCSGLVSSYHQYL